LLRTLIKNKKHLTVEGMNNIVALKGIINHGLALQTEELKLSFPDHISLIRASNSSLCNMDTKLDPYWISGFIEGDGSFIINLKTTCAPAIGKKTVNTEEREEGLSVSAVLSIGLDIREEPLLFKIKTFFNSLGNVYSSQTRGVVEFKIFKLQDLLTIIPPAKQEKYPLLGFKSYIFSILKEIVNLINKKDHFTLPLCEKVFKKLRL